MSSETWNIKKKYFKQFLKKKFYPEPYILKSFFSEDFSNIKLKKKNKLNVLDVGGLYLNNLLAFNKNNNKLYATEISKNTVEILNKIHKGKCIIKVGTNRSLPFKDNFFDIILSINTIHYEQNPSEVELALKEFKRVLKKGGIVFIETVGPKDFFRNTKTSRIRKNIFQCIDKTDIRYGQKFTYFNNEAQLKTILEKYFKIFEIGERCDKFPKRILNGFMIKCKK